MGDNYDKYVKAFIAEAEESLQSMNTTLLELENDPGRRDLIDEMFRHAHTIKGGAASMGYEDIASLAHEMETLMDKFRSQNVRPDSSVTGILFEGLDLLEMLVANVAKEGKRKIEIAPLINKLASMSVVQPSLKPEVVERGQTEVQPRKSGLIKKKYNIQIRVNLQDNCVFKAVRAIMVLANLRKIGEIVNTTPDVRDIEDEKFDGTFTIFFATKEHEKKIRKAVEAVPEVGSVDIFTLSQPSLRTPVLSETQTVRVDIGRLDRMMNLVGELVIDKIRFIQIGSVHEIPELIETIAHMDRSIADLQHEVMQARLVPVGQIFNRFPRMVRDLTKVEDKKVDFVMEGTEIEVDRTMLDRITDPLIHILRNAVDHGIESAAEREQAGKSEIGSVTLTATREKEDVVIEVSDDGQGIDPDLIFDIANRKGIVAADEGAGLTDRDKVMLICAPGLSTSQEATSVSGRGVGMDVVKTTVEALGGMVAIDSKKGLGTKIILKLPLTMVIMRGMLVKVQQETFVVPLVNLQEIVRVRADGVKKIKGEEAISLRGEVIPIMRLDRILDLNPDESPKSEFDVLLMEIKGKRAGLVVDRLLGQQEIVIKSLDGYLKGVKGCAGATILGDGKVAFILDTASLVL